LKVREHHGRFYCQAHAPLEASWRCRPEVLQALIDEGLKPDWKIDLTAVVFPIFENNHYQLGGTVTARHCTFEGGVSLIGANLDMSDSQCLGSLWLNCNGGKVIARRVHFFGDVTIRCGSVEGLDFSDSTADREFKLEHVVMATSGLKLDGMKLAAAPSIEFNIEAGSGMPQNWSFRRLSLRTSAYGKDAEGRFRTIRNRLHQNRDREHEGIFYQYEKRAKRMSLPLGQPSSWLPRSVSACYDWLAGYGQSYERAFGWFIGVQAVFVLLYSIMSGRFEWCGTFDSQVAAFTLAQVVKPFELLSARTPTGWPYVGVYMGGSGWWTIATTVDTLLSLTLVALFLLALRWRFRRD
jgi:hypothetical protein